LSSLPTPLERGYVDYLIPTGNAAIASSFAQPVGKVVLAVR
jgi:hypothetical protein